MKGGGDWEEEEGEIGKKWRGGKEGEIGRRREGEEEGGRERG